MNTFRAVVQTVHEGPHGKFVIATANDLEGSVTFSLNQEVWQEADVPEHGTEVMLSDLRRNQRGWRAMSARYVRPSDQQVATSKKKENKMGFSQRGFDREYRADVNEGIAAGTWTFWRFFWTIVPIILFLSVAAYGIRLATQPARIIEKTFDADNVVHNYEWFKQRFQSIQAIDKKIVDAEAAVEQFKEDAGPRENWHREDREEASRLSSIALGLKQQRADLAAEYNARSKMANRAIFKAGDVELPETISLD